MDLSFFPALIPYLVGSGCGAAATYLLINMRRLRLAKYFGDLSLELNGKKAEYAHQLARECLRPPRVAVPWKRKTDEPL